jgi:uncharacterized membrane protein YhaH (DUF805 family)
MTFLDAVRVCVAKYSDFDGRATRSEYWWFFLAVLIGSAAASTDPMLGVVFSVAAFVPMLAVGARRLHDTNRSGWWQLLVVVPFGFIVVLAFLVQPGSREAIESR